MTVIVANLFFFFFEIQLTYNIILDLGIQHDESIFVYIAK